MKYAKPIIGSLVLIAATAAVTAWVVLSQRPATPPAPVPPLPATQSAPSSAAPAPQSSSTQSAPAPHAKPAGFYGGYSDQRMALRYDKTILFFHASWCGECQAFDKVLRESAIPHDVQILKVDYDSRQDLRQRYGVTHQTTFVEVDDDDDADHDHDIWVGHGKEKSLQAILRNLD